MNAQLQKSVSFLRSQITSPPNIAIVLGSGLGDFAQQIKNPIILQTADIPHYPVSTVPGHAGKILFGSIESAHRSSSQLMVFQGRVHFYECEDVQKVVFPIRVAAELGIKNVIITNAAGGINRNFEAGTLMFIRDYINLTGENPLIGMKMSDTSTVPDILSNLNPDLLHRAKSIALKHGIVTTEGVYCWTKGPSYETSAEIQMMESFGADAVGMSTVPEIMVAHQYDMNVLGISCITNMATGISPTKLSHNEVTETANKVKTDFTKLITEIIFSI